MGERKETQPMSEILSKEEKIDINSLLYPPPIFHQELLLAEASQSPTDVETWDPEVEGVSHSDSKKNMEMEGNEPDSNQA